jgi:hypothetical protein
VATCLGYRDEYIYEYIIEVIIHEYIVQAIIHERKNKKKHEIHQSLGL